MFAYRQKKAMFADINAYRKYAHSVATFNIAMLHCCTVALLQFVAIRCNSLQRRRREKLEKKTKNAGNACFRCQNVFRAALKK